MARVESSRTRQALLVVGTALEMSPLPEKLELFTEDQIPVDVGKDRTRARWRGTWSSMPTNPYEQNDFVINDGKLYILSDITAYEEGIEPGLDTTGAWVLMTISGGMAWAGEWDEDTAYRPEDVITYDGGLWITSEIMGAGSIPGVTVDDADLTINRGVQFKESDRFASEDPVTIIIGDPPDGQRRDNDISAGYSAAILLDRIGVVTGLLTITPIAPVAPAGMYLAGYTVGNEYDGDWVLSWTGEEVVANTPKTIDLGAQLDSDRFIHVFFDGGIDGSFTAYVSDATNLVAPPDYEAVWELIFQPPVTGTDPAVTDAIDDLETATGSLDTRLTTLESAGPAVSILWGGVWDDEVQYEPMTMVRHEAAMYFAVDGAAEGSEPGVVLDTTDDPPGSAPAGSYSRINVGNNLAVPWDATGALVFFDLSVGGTIVINTDIPLQYNHLFNDTGTEIATSPGLSNPMTATGLAAGRYFVQCQPGGGGSGTATVNLALSAGAQAPSESWELMLEDTGGGGGIVEDWHEVGDGGEPAFTNSWDAHASADHAPRFRKRPDGMVELRGLIISGTTDLSAFTLPSGYRPDSPGGLQMICMAAAVSTGNPTPVRVDVNPDGTVVPYIAGSAIVWLSIAALSFSVD